MRIAIASGKGGAGKTTVTASLAHVWEEASVIVDADVEAPNLHLFCAPEMEESQSSFLEVPELDASKCTACGICSDFCQFAAIAKLGKSISVFPDMCHGCGGCLALCPEEALRPAKRLLGVLEYGTIMQGKHAFLMGRARVGEAMSPPQIRLLQKKLESMLATKHYQDALIDAPPGVSCPAMTVAREADLILLVAEPTPFGIHDFLLAHKAFSLLQKPLAVVINRAAMPGNTGDQYMSEYCAQKKLPVLARLPFSPEIATHYAHSGIAAAYSASWREHFIALRASLRSFATRGGCHA